VETNRKARTASNSPLKDAYCVYVGCGNVESGVFQGKGASETSMTGDGEIVSPLPKVGKLRAGPAGVEHP
jgi:hypothetical protein